MYFEDARLEFFGVPLAYMPYFSAPDPTVKRKTGFLMPIVSARVRSTASRSTTPYYWALAPDYDVTFTPMITTRQGPLLQGEFRQRLIERLLHDPRRRHLPARQGRCSSRRRPTTPGDRDFRGSIETIGQFNLTDKWVWGWDGTVADRQDVLPGLRPAADSMSHDNLLVLIDAGLRAVAALSGRPRRSQLFRHAHASISTASPPPTSRARSRSSIRSSTTTTPSISRSSAASSASTAI